MHLMLKVEPLIQERARDPNAQRVSVKRLLWDQRVFNIVNSSVHRNYIEIHDIMAILILGFVIPSGQLYWGPTLFKV